MTSPAGRGPVCRNRNRNQGEKTVRNRLYAALLGAGLTCTAPGVASAHVVITHMNQSAGWEGAVLTLLVPHGCGADPTTEVRMKVPENVNMVLPEPKPGWKIELTKRKLPAPKKVGNREITEVQDEVIWSGGSLPGDHAGLFTFVTNFANKPGERVYFKTIQKCGAKEEKWIDTVTAEEEMWRIWLKPLPSPFVVLGTPAQPQLFAPFETIAAERKKMMEAAKKP
jgi:hypothetical protein